MGSWILDLGSGFIDSWKSNINNIKLYFKDSIYLLKMTLSEQQKKEIAEQQTQKNTTKRVTSPELEKIT